MANDQELEESMSEFQTYRFRAECYADAARLFRLIWSDLRKASVDVVPPFPDVEVTMEIRLSIEEVRQRMHQIEDSQVMVETLAMDKEYTGVRQRAA